MDNVNQNPNPIVEALALAQAVMRALQNAQNAPENDYAFRIAALKQAAQLAEDALKNLKADISWLEIEMIRSIFRGCYADQPADEESVTSGGDNGSH